MTKKFETTQKYVDYCCRTSTEFTLLNNNYIYGPLYQESDINECIWMHFLANYGLQFCEQANLYCIKSTYVNGVLNLEISSQWNWLSKDSI